MTESPCPCLFPWDEVELTHCFSGPDAKASLLSSAQPQ